MNPAEALYCYHDGAALDGLGRPSGPLAIGAQRWLHPFVFPSGQTCRSFDELVVACETQWTEALELLQQGYLEGFLAGLGRADLARAARQAAKVPDRQLGLDQFLNKLPASTREAPRLFVQPQEINLGQLSRTRDQRLVLELTNQGMGLLSGTVTCADVPWLSLASTPGISEKLFECRRDLSLPVHVIGKFLRAGAKPIEGKLAIATSGGTVTVVVRAEVPVTPFAEGVLAGAKTPRQIAEKAKASPKEAASLFEKGAVAAWYTTNGWTYPVQGPAASGLGAVQQFFEALGLVTPPKVEISTDTVRLQGRVGATLETTLQVQTPEKRPVFAWARTETPWLQVGRALLDGRTARIPVRVPLVPAFPGECLLGQVLVTANGNQRFTVDVALDVTGQPSGKSKVSAQVFDMARIAAVPVLTAADLVTEPHAPVARLVELPEVLPANAEPVPVVLPYDAVSAPPVRKPGPVQRVELVSPGLIPEVIAVEDEPKSRSGWLHLLPLGFLFACLLVPICRDFLLGRGMGGDLDLIDDKPRIGLLFHDEKLDVTLGQGGVKPGDGPGINTGQAWWYPSMRFGLVMLDTKELQKPGYLDSLSDQELARIKPKRLTFEYRGLTNNTVIRLDGAERIYGEQPFHRMNRPKPPQDPGNWLETRLQKGDETATKKFNGRHASWVYDREKVVITQTVEIIPGAQSRLLDTALVRYQIENRDTRPHRIGLRFLLDTFIGENDGVPFLIPGEKQLCVTSKDFNGRDKIPDFIQACQYADLTKPGTIAQIQLKLGGRIEQPDRVTLGAWPNVQLANRDIRCLQEKTMWEVPVLPINTFNPGDSAVVMYWNERELKAGETREVGFTYGLGDLAGGEGKGKLAVTVGGSFQPRGEFTVTAYVNDPVANQTATLTVPEGFELVDCKDKQPVPVLPPNATSRNSPVTWKVKAPSTEGKYSLKVEASNGVSQTQPVKIRAHGIFGN
jgi:hypothetical protein